MEIIAAALVSALAQYLKQHMPNEYYTVALVACLSIVAAAVYTTLVATGFWETALRIMTISGAIYAFIIARFETKQVEG